MIADLARPSARNRSQRQPDECGASLLEAVFALALLAVLALSATAAQWTLNRSVKTSRDLMRVEATARRALEEVASLAYDDLLALDGNETNVDELTVHYSAEVVEPQIVQVTLTVDGGETFERPVVLTFLKTSR